MSAQEFAGVAVPPARAMDRETAGRLAGRALPALLGIAALLALLPRIAVLPLSGLDIDESIYALVARDLLNGAEPYDGVYDHKPVALFYAFAAFEFAFGETVVALRLLALTAVCATALLIVGAVRAVPLPGARLGAAAAGCMYLLASVQNGGMATNSEIIVNAYMAGAIFVAVRTRLFLRVRPAPSLLAGALLAGAFHTNYLAGFLIVGFATAFGLLVLAQPSSEPGPAPGYGRAARTYLGNGVLIFGGFVGTTALLLAPVALSGNLPEYVRLQHAFLSGYQAKASVGDALSEAVDALGKYLPGAAVTALALALTWNARSALSARPYLMAGAAVAAYGGACLLAAGISGRLYPHYFVLLTLPLALAAGASLAGVAERSRAVLAVGGLSLALVFAYGSGWIREDASAGLDAYANLVEGQPADATAEIVGAVAPGASLYVYDHTPMFYYLTGAPSPTRFAFPDHHLHVNESRALGVDRPAEMRRILATRPQFIVLGSDPSDGRHGTASDLLAGELRANYETVLQRPTSERPSAVLLRRREGLTN